MRKISLPIGILTCLLAVSFVFIQRTAGQGVQPTPPPSTATITPTQVAPNLTATAPASAQATARATAQSATPQATGAPSANWSVPYNLSRSGGAADPQLLGDSNGRYHAIWQDAIDGFMYASGDGYNWSAPLRIEAPFSTRQYFTDLPEGAETPQFPPRLIADATGSIHAFWVDDSGPGQPILYHSETPAAQLAQFSAWSARTAVDSGVSAVTAAADEAGRLHVAYVRNRESDGKSPGIYYVQQRADGTWSAPISLYYSRYLRMADEETANVQIAAGSDGVHIAWDDPGREQVFIARSADGGQTWGPIQEVDHRTADDAPEAEGPGQIRVGLSAAGPIIVWRAGHTSGELCTQYFRFSADGGATWSTTEQLSESLPGCLASAEFIRAGMPVLLGTTQTNELDQRAYLLAWDGTRWSEPQMQPSLSSFNNSETNQLVNLQCLRGIGAGDRLNVIGCDAGAGQDVWWSTRPLNDVAGWFGAPSLWQGPEPIAITNGATGGLLLVADELGATHLYWHEAGGATISYSRREGQTWTPVVAVITAQEGAISDLAAAGGNGRLYLVWRDSSGLYFSQASNRQPTEMSSPSRLPDLNASAAAPMILPAGDELLITYAVQLNEGRGVYLIRSGDGGASWSEPALVFDGAAAGWEMVDQPELARTGDGALHAQYVRRSFPPDSAPLDLAYARSGDNGLTWTPSETPAGVAAAWSALLGTRGLTVHRLWAEPAEERLMLRHTVSFDGGLNWSEPEQFAVLPGGQTPAATADPAGRLYVAGMDGGRLLNWVWDGDGWHSGDPLMTNLTAGGLMSAVVNLDPQFMVALNTGSAGDAEAAQALHVMARPLELLAEGALTASPLPRATLTATSTPAPPTPTPTLEPTPTIDLSAGAAGGGFISRLPGANSQAGQLGLAIIPAAFVVLVVVVVALRAVRMGRKS